MSTKPIEGLLDASGRRFAIVAARFNDLIVDRLVGGAVDTLVRHGASNDDIDIVRCPGAYELPLTTRHVITARKPDAVIALGCLIRGGTPHFDYIAGYATKGIGQVSLDAAVPVAFGLLTCDTLEQALERAGTKMGNKGVEAALAAIEMADLVRQLMP